MLWDGIFNVQCVEQKETLINVEVANFGFVEVICTDIEDVRRVDDGYN